jgi:hypothetical protein
MRTVIIIICLLIVATYCVVAWSISHEVTTSVAVPKRLQVAEISESDYEPVTAVLLAESRAPCRATQLHMAKLVKAAPQWWKSAASAQAHQELTKACMPLNHLLAVQQHQEALATGWGYPIY